MPRAPTDPGYINHGRARMPDYQVLIMRQTITLLERRHGVTKADIARAAGVHRVLITRLFKPPLCADGEPKVISRCYAHKICEGLMALCRRHNIDPLVMEQMLQHS